MLNMTFLHRFIIPPSYRSARLSIKNKQFRENVNVNGLEKFILLNEMPYPWQ